MADGSNNYYSENYPYNVVPQVKRPAPSEQLPNLACPPDYSRQFIVIDDNKLSVIQGYNSKAFFDLKDFFISIENNYQLYEFKLKFDGDFTKFVTLNYNNIGENEKIKFILIFPQYQYTEIEDQNLWYIHYKFLDEIEIINTDNIDEFPQNELMWKHLGRILMIDSSKERMLSPIYLQNRLGDDIILKILIAF